MEGSVCASRSFPWVWCRFPRILSLSVLAGFTTVGAFAGESSYKPPTAHYYCTSNPAPKTRYYSALFDASSSGDVYQQITDDFKKFVAQTYSYDGPATCFGNPDKSAAQKQMQQQITQLKNINKWKIVETGWTDSASGQEAAGASHPDCNSSDGWKSVAEYKAACEGGTQSGGSGVQAPSPQSENTASQTSSAQSQSSGAGTSSAGGESNAAAAVMTLAVRIAEAVDSSKDGMGHQYHGVVTKAASAGGVTIPQGSPAILVLSKNQSGWVAQLHSVMVKGQTITVSSGPATLMNSSMGSAQNVAAGAMNTVSSALGGFGFGHKKPHTPSTAEAAVSGQRIVLPPGTQLQFTLNGASPVGATPAGAMGNTMASSGPASANLGTGSAGAPVATPVGNLGGKVTETLLGPMKPLGQSVVSPDGGHYAVASMHGSREMVIIDGVPGPDYDHAGHLQGTGLDVAFSEDGKHSCYIAQRGDQLVEVRDNKEAFVVTTYFVPPMSGNVPVLAPVSLHGTSVANPGHQCLISASGSHMAVVSSETSANTSTVWHVFLDGAKGPGYPVIDVNLMAFVGEKLVYAAQSSDQKWHMVVNANPGPGYDKISSLLLNHNDTHYAFITQNSGGHQVVVDGVAGPVRAHGGNGVHDLTLASNGRCAYIWDKPLGVASHDGMDQVLVVDEKEIADHIQPFATEDTSLSLNSVIHILFSSDGKKVAYAKKVPGGVASVIDGKVSRAYDAIGITAFSPDSAHGFFVGVRNQNFVVVDGEELEGFNRANGFVWSKQGGRLAFVGWAQDGYHFVVDGKKTPRYYSAMNKTLSFSPDSKHYVYAACTNYMKCVVVMDGNETPVPDIAELTTRSQPRFEFPPIFWSDDSSRLAYAHTNADGTNNTVFIVNGQAVMHNTGLYEYPDFSPDSKHFATLYWTGHGYALFLDGKTGAAYENLLEANRNVGRFENSHAYRFLGIKNGSVYRVTADLASIN